MIVFDIQNLTEIYPGITLRLWLDLGMLLVPALVTGTAVTRNLDWRHS